jgi:hypothetical protein
MTKQIADEAMEVWQDAFQAWRGKSHQAAAAVITAKLAEKDAEIARLSEALRYYGHQFCELGESHECCGRLSEDDCSGCFARQALTRKEA